MIELGEELTERPEVIVTGIDCEDIEVVNVESEITALFDGVTETEI